MSTSPHDPLPPELGDVGRLMRAERRQPSALELDDLKRRVRRQGASRSSLAPLARKGSLLTSRLLITMLVAFGVVLSGTGATLAIAPNVVDTGSPTSAAQYGDDNGGGNVAGESASDDPGIGALPNPPVSGSRRDDPRVRRAVDRDGDPPKLQPARQLAQEGDEKLPFTGLAAIPVLVIGIGLLASGLVLRRRA